MPKTKSIKKNAEQPDLAAASEPVEDSMEGLERLAGSELEMSKWFIANDKKEIASRRLRGII